MKLIHSRNQFIYVLTLFFQFPFLRFLSYPKLTLLVVEDKDWLVLDLIVSFLVVYVILGSSYFGTGLGINIGRNLSFGKRW